MKKLGFWLRTLISAIFFALLLIPLLGPPLYVEVSNAVAPGVVVAKREEITVRRSFWSRRLFLDVRYEPTDTEAPELAPIVVDAQRYDRARVGAPVQVRYLPLPNLRELGAIAAPRLEDQPPLGPLRAQLSPARDLLIGLAIWLVLLAVWAKWRRWWLALPTFAIMIGGSLYLASNWPPPAPPGPQLAANATVRATHEIDRAPWSRRSKAAAQPYTIVELSFVPAGMADPVVAVDLVDAGSVPRLRTEATLPIHYSAADPRWARIDGAARTYAWRNLFDYGLIALLIVALVLGLWGAHRLRATRQARRRAP